MRSSNSRIIALLVFLFLGFTGAGWVAHSQNLSAPTQPATTSSVPSSTVAGLPTCNASLNGRIYLVTDLLLPTILGTITGGGAVTALVHCNGTNWVGG